EPRVDAAELPELAAVEEAEVDHRVARRAAGARLDAEAVRVVLLVTLDGDLERAVLGVCRRVVRLHGLEGRVDLGAILEGGHVEIGGAHERGDDVGIEAPLELREELAPTREVLDQAAERLARERVAAGLGAHEEVLGAALEEEVVERLLVLEELHALAAGDLVERRLRDVEVALLDELRHLPVEEGEEQRPDVGSVDVGVGHDDDVVVAELRDVEVLSAGDAASERRDERPDLGRREHLVEARALDVEDLAAEREDRLRAAMAALLGRAAGRITLDDVELADRGVLALAVGELARERARVEGALALHHLPRATGGLARLRRDHDL